MHQMVSHGDYVHRGGGRRAHILFFPHSSIVAAPHGSLPLSLVRTASLQFAFSLSVFAAGCEADIRSVEETT